MNSKQHIATLGVSSKKILSIRPWLDIHLFVEPKNFNSFYLYCSFRFDNRYYFSGNTTQTIAKAYRKLLLLYSSLNSLYPNPIVTLLMSSINSHQYYNSNTIVAQ